MTRDDVLAAVTAAALPPMMSMTEASGLLGVLSTLPDDAHIVEFGCGGSTTMLVPRLTAGQHLYGVEHSVGWHDKVTTALAGYAGVTVCLRPPLITPGYADPTEELPVGLGRYLDGQYGQDWDKVGMVLVDGLARGPALSMMRHRLRSGTAVFVHDMYAYGCEADRIVWYEWATALYHHVGRLDSMAVLSVDAPSASWAQVFTPVLQQYDL